MNFHLQKCLECLDKHLQAENHHDLEAIMATYGSNPLVNINGQIFSGEAAVRLFHDRFGFGGNGSFSDVQVKEKKRFISDDHTIIIQQELHGRHTQRWQGHEPTGKTFTMPVATFYSFNDQAQLIREDVYFDSLVLLKQLGLL